MEVAYWIYEVRGIICPVDKARCGSLGRYPQFGGESGESLVLEEPLRLVCQDFPFERRLETQRPQLEMLT